MIPVKGQRRVFVTAAGKHVEYVVEDPQVGYGSVSLLNPATGKLAYATPKWLEAPPGTSGAHWLPPNVEAAR